MLGLQVESNIELAIAIDNMPLLFSEEAVKLIESGLPQEDVEVELFWGRDELSNFLYL